MSLFNSGSKGAKFPNVGDSITGTVTAAPTERQQTKFGSQDPDYWPDGSPKMQIVVSLQTTLRDPSDPHDDGERTLYVASKNMKRAIGDAIRAAGAADLLPGGTLTVTYVGNDPASKNPAQPAKLYQAQYTPGASAFAQPTAVTPAPAAAPAPQAVPQSQATPQPAQATPAPAAPPAAQQPGSWLTPEQIGQLAQLRAAGIPEASIAAALGTTADQIAAHDASVATPF